MAASFGRSLRPMAPLGNTHVSADRRVDTSSTFHPSASIRTGTQPTCVVGEGGGRTDESRNDPGGGGAVPGSVHEREKSGARQQQHQRGKQTTKSVAAHLSAARGSCARCYPPHAANKHIVSKGGGPAVAPPSGTYRFPPHRKDVPLPGGSSASDKERKSGTAWPAAPALTTGAGSGSGGGDDTPRGRGWAHPTRVPPAAASHEQQDPVGPLPGAREERGCGGVRGRSGEDARPRDRRGGWRWWVLVGVRRSAHHGTAVHEWGDGTPFVPALYKPLPCGRPPLPRRCRLSARCPAGCNPRAPSLSLHASCHPHCSTAQTACKPPPSSLSTNVCVWTPRLGRAA